MAAVLWTIQPRTTDESRFGNALMLLRNGDFERAAEAAAQAEKGSTTPALRLRFRLLRVEALLENGKSEAALSLLDSGEPTHSIEYDVRSRVLRARMFIGKAKLPQAEELLVAAQKMAVSAQRPDLRAEVELLLGQTFGRQRRLTEAHELFVRAGEAARVARDPFRMAAAVNNLGMVRMIQSHCDEAIPLFEKAQELYQAAAANHWVAAARNNIGLCYSQLGDLESAFTYRQAALGLSRPSALKANALGETGTVLLAKSPAKAIPYYRQARDMARQFGALPDAARWAGNLASALAAAGDWDAAESALEDGRQLGPEPRSRAFFDLTAASIALGRGQPAQARAIYERLIAGSGDNPAILWEANAGMARVHVSENAPEQAGRSFETAIRIVEEAQSELNRNEHRITFLARLILLYRDYVDLLMSRNETVRALSIADRSRARLLSERLSRRVGGSGSLFEADLRSIAKRSGSVWLAYWIAPKRSFMWAVTPAQVRAFPLPGEAEIAPLVNEYRAFVATALRDPLQTPNEAGRKLYEMLIAPVAPMLKPGGLVTIVPDGPLHQLSFDTLPVYDGKRPRYFLDDATVAVTPSFSVFRRGGAEPVSGRDALIIGDPVSPAPAYPSLRHAGQEIANVARRMASARTVVIKGEHARPSVWKTSEPGRFSAIHIAAHAEANESSPLDSAIILSDANGYRLYARDIIDIPLRADLVSLSACRSSGARAYAGEGMVGFAWAFLHAGAGSVIAGMWDLADESTSMLMDTLYTRIALGDPPVHALRTARLALRNSAYSKPYYWGGFQCYTR